MASPDQQQYPDNLNPFGSDEEIEKEADSSHEQGTRQNSNTFLQAPKINIDEYPDHLSPFGDDDDNGAIAEDDYDDSLNPFGEEESEKNPQDETKQSGAGNPFEEAEERHEEHVESKSLDQSLPPPPVPLPRTKSLLKKEQAQKNRQSQLLADQSASTAANSLDAKSDNTNSFQRKKNKRNAPPVPVNYKRQVSGSLDAIEEELNDIGDKLAIIEKESNLCQENLKATHKVDEAQFKNNRSDFLNLIKRKNSIVRRQKELMYRKRELKLDQIHSDIEYELRMIGNKQLSNRTAEDESREKELLGKLVEIVEEKNDIVENLNKDTSCDSQEVEDILRRLCLTNDSPQNLDSEDVKNVSQKNDSCDKSSIAIGTKLSKIATLLPTSGTIKGKMKFKRKRLFKKCDSHPIER